MGKRLTEHEIQKYDWVVFAQSFLYLARLGCQELLSEDKNKHSKNDMAHYPYQVADLYVPILFNIKHGIEVFVKALSLFAYGEYEEGHDVKELFTTTKKTILSKKQVPRQKGFYDGRTQVDINGSIQDLEEIEQLVLYFYELEFLKEKIKTEYVMCDSLNDVLRYPKNKASIRIDWGTILSSRVERADAECILEKLSLLSNLFNKAGYHHAVLNR